MFTLKKLGLALFIMPVICLAGLVISALAGWQFSFYFTYSFFISWAALFLYYVVTVWGFQSVILLLLAMGATGLYLDLVNHPKTEVTLLIGKIALAVFTLILAIRLFRMRNELEGKIPVFAGLIVLLLLRSFLEKTDIAIRHAQQPETLSLDSLSNYFTIAVITNILWNDNYGMLLTEGEKKVLLIEVMFCLYNISLMLIYNFG